MDYRHDDDGPGNGGGDRGRSSASRAQRADICIQFMDKLQQLQEASHMCDLIFELRGQQFLAHRVVVAAWSPLIYSLCSHDSIECEKIRVHYDNLEVFGSFLAFLYAGQMNSVAEDNLIQVLHLATSLQVNGLRQTCEEALKRQLHIGNIISTFHVARKFRLPNLEEYALNFMQMNLPEAVKQADFLSLSPSRFNSFLSSGWVCVMKPEVKLFLIISWLGYDVKERQQYLILLLKYIDWSTVANDFLLEISQTENFFTTNESSLYLLLQTLFSSTIPLGPYTDLFPGLRERYGYLLEHIVQNSYVLPLEPEEYFPVTFYLVNQTPSTDTRSMNNTCTTGEARKCRDSAQQARNVEEDSNDGGDIGDLADVSGGDELNVTFDGNSAVENAVGDAENASRDKSVTNHSPSQIRGGKSKTPEAIASPGSTRRKGGRSHRLGRKSFPVTAPTTSSPQKEKGKRKGPIRLKYKECQKSEQQQIPAESQEAESTSGHDALTTHANPDTVTGTTPLRSKRKAAAKFSVPEKLMPRRKTKAALKQQDDKQEPTQPEKEGESTVTTPRRSIGDKNKCDECDYTAPSTKRLARHIQHVHSGNTTIYSCTLCKFECRWNRRYYSHMRQHFEGPPFVCDKEGCGYSADRVQLLLTHRRKHTDERPFKCNLCSAGFRSRNNLYAHRKCHSEDRNFECPVCQRCFKMKNTMEQHLVTHSDLRPYLCDTCGFSTKFQSHLIAHKRIHTGEVFHCSFPMCTYTSPKRSQLKAHMRSHLKIRHHICNICQKGFVERSHLVRHIKIHEEARPFRCEECDYNSTRIDKLREHINKHHGEEPSVKRKWLPRNRKSDKNDKATSTLRRSSPRKGKPVDGRPTSLRDGTWVSSMEASIATLVSAAEEVRLASQSPLVETDVRDGLAGSVPLPTGFRPAAIQESMGGSGMAEFGERQVEYVPHSYKHETVASASPAARDMGTGQVMLVNSARNGGLSTPSQENQRVAYEVLQPPQQQPQSHLRPILPQHTSATLLQQLAMSVSSSSSGQQRPLLQHSQQHSVQVGDSNPDPNVVPHTTDMATASQILLSAMQQHAHRDRCRQSRGDAGSQMAQQVLQHSSNLPPLAPAQIPQQQHHHHSHPQTHPDSQHQDYSGLNAFMALF
ncbi:hypothetical protein BaRGS_00023636 [Batillaria attramentaria]|uniref:Uncharacterized protein n=1 Tax=Batillaria attramentaria TaxID=370345 RepID=A0ABD0KD71_9CAEN